MATQTEAATPFQLDFNPESNEFTIIIQEVTEVSYLLQYELETEDSQPTEELESTPSETEQRDQLETPVSHAFVDAVAADETNQVTITQLAGSESSGNQYLHAVQAGSLEFEAKTPANQVVEVTQLFEITDGELVLAEFTQQVASASAVLGEATDPELDLTQVSQTTQAPPPLQPVSVTPAAADSSAVGVIAASVMVTSLVVAAVAAGSWWWFNKRGSTKQTPIVQAQRAT